MLSLLSRFTLEMVRLLGEMAPYLTLGFVFAGLLHVFVPRQAVARHLGGQTAGAVIRAAMLGVPLPLCSCGVVPTAMGLRKRGASVGAVVSFLISTPQTGLDSIFATYGFFGWLFAIFRPVAAFVSGIAGGLATLIFNRNTADESHWLQYHVAAEDALNETQPHSLLEKLKNGARFAFMDLLGDIALWLVIGLAVAAVIALVIPDDFFAGRLPSGFAQMLVMMAFGIPLYVCSTASIPIAAVLMAKGISAGAAFVFLMTGPATNAATLMIIGRVMGKRVLSVYLGSIAVLALAFGLGLDALAVKTGLNTHMLMHHEHGQMVPLWLTWGSAGLLTFFIALHFWRTAVRRWDIFGSERMTDKDKGLDLIVEGMNCSHCVRTVTQSLKNVPGVTVAEVSLEKGLAHVEGAALNRAQLAKAVEDVGYTVKK
jgi:uncharacterized protein